MASKKTKRTTKLVEKDKHTFLSGFCIDKYIPVKYQIAVLAVIILLLFLYFFSPLYFEGKTFQSGDIVTSKSATTYIDNNTGEFTLWNPYVFGGMPAYAIAVGYKWFNLIFVTVEGVRTIFSSPFTVDYAKWTFYLLALAYTMFAFFYLQ